MFECLPQIAILKTGLQDKKILIIELGLICKDALYLKNYSREENANSECLYFFSLLFWFRTPNHLTVVMKKHHHLQPTICADFSNVIIESNVQTGSISESASSKIFCNSLTLYLVSAMQSCIVEVDARAEPPGL